MIQSLCFRILMVLLLFVCQPPYQIASGQGSSFRNLEDDPDLEEKTWIRWFVRGEKLKQHQMLANELQFLEFILSIERHSPLVTGKHRIDGVYADERFDPILKKTKEISAEIAVKRKQGLSEEDREALTVDVLKRLDEILPFRSIAAMRQCEIFVNGPVRYFQRDDNRAFYGIKLSQLQAMVKVAQQEGERHAAFYEDAKAKLIIGAFDILDDRQRIRAQKVFGLPEERTAALYKDFPDEKLALVSRFAFYGLKEARAKGTEEEYLREYSEELIDILFSAFSRDDDSVIRDSIWLPKHTQIKSYRLTSDVGDAPAILDQIRRILNESPHPLSDEQTKEFDLMMNGTDEIDGIVTKPNSFDQIPLRSRRLQRKLRPFAGTLTDAQRQIARDVILLMFGPTRILLCPTVADELGMDGEMRLAILKNALAKADALEANRLKSKERSFTAVLDKLTAQQERQLSERVGLSLNELAQRYAPISEESFALDFPPH